MNEYDSRNLGSGGSGAQSLPLDGLVSARRASNFLGIAVRSIYKEKWRDALQAVNIAPPGSKAVLRFPVERLRAVASGEALFQTGAEEENNENL